MNALAGSVSPNFSRKLIQPRPPRKCFTCLVDFNESKGSTGLPLAWTYAICSISPRKRAGQIGVHRFLRHARTRWPLASPRARSPLQRRSQLFELEYPCSFHTRKHRASHNFPRVTLWHVFLTNYETLPLLSLLFFSL